MSAVEALPRIRTQFEGLASSSSSSAPLPKSPSRRLRSCLSPTRLRTIEHPLPETPNCTPTTSRSTSFTSDYVSEWRRKSVRWQGEEEGCAVTSYFSTWSATEYDRTPLEPPSAGERACVLPERGSRCFSPLNCFLDEGVFAEPDEFEAISFDNLPFSEEYCPESPEKGEVSEEEEAEEQSAEDREWEECMERRRMMFAQMQCGGDRERLGFEGYTSLSCALADMLRSSSCIGPSTPLEGVVEELEDISEVPTFGHFEVSEGSLIVIRTPELSVSDGSEGDSVLASPEATDAPRIIIEAVVGDKVIERIHL